jgi:hypothetical protein
MVTFVQKSARSASKEMISGELSLIVNLKPHQLKIFVVLLKNNPNKSTIFQVVTRFAEVLGTSGTVKTNGAILIQLVTPPITLLGSC